MALNVEDTKTAFRAKTDSELRRSYWLYSLLNSRTLGKLGETSVKAALALHLPIEFLIRKTIFQQFCGGETIEECKGTIEKLARYHIGTVLDYSVEAGHTEKSFDATTQEILKTVDLAARDRNIAFCVFKVSGISPFELLEKVSRKESLSTDEKKEWEGVEKRVLEICNRAYHSKVRIFIDAEETWIQPAIDTLAEQMMKRFNRERALVYNTLQMYRTDRLAFLKESVKKAEAEKYFLGIKLVRGAYMEKERARAAQNGIESPIYPDKESTDKAYDEALVFSVDHVARMAFAAGTHNEQSTLLLANLMDQHGLSHDDERIYFSQLLGMGEHLTYNLAEAGYHTAKYVPYGPVRAVMPYLFRRAEENTSIQGQTSRELSLLKREAERRKSE